MLSKFIKNSIDKLLLFTFNKLPIRIIKKVLWLLHCNPELGDKWGYSIRQYHYYEPLPEFSTITKKKVLRRRFSSCINWNLESQLDLIDKLSNYYTEIHQLSVKEGVKQKFNFLNDLYFELDAALYYAILREKKPSKVIEIGAGYSTQIASIALDKNQQEGKKSKIICIDPYYSLKPNECNFDIEIITKKVETIHLSLFEQLKEGDILFIDSTHTVKFCSDVCREILEILPAIANGVWIHFHDIFFPYDYPPKWLIEERRAWNEQYMLEAFLAYNSSFEVILANHWLSIDHPEKVAKLWSEVLNWKEPHHRCSGFWIRKTSYR
ncbi:MAG: class I SAM-dependent methyltransferase [Coleofasciculus sp. A1-SPW-01]|uniref:class I SAM-dependent methyltransferase n=1 Tax=Coleofasciculus sp. A1-SPW-01 TaxID=3070819 RepID=UPI0032FE563E